MPAAKKNEIFVILTDRQIQHGIKHQDKCYISAVSCKNINDIYLSHDHLANTEYNSQHRTEKNIHEHSHIIAGQDILIFSS